MSRVEVRWRTMGCDAAVWLAAPDRTSAELDALADAIRGEIDDVAARLTRFDPRSELCRLNADPRLVVPASTVMRRFVLAARHAGVLTGGLVDATLLGDLERAGYTASMAPHTPPAAPAAAPRGASVSSTRQERASRRGRGSGGRRAAGPHPDRAHLTLEAGIAAVVRPPGTRLDAGGIGKGLAADLAARRVPSGVRHAISVGGDLAVGGAGEHRVDVLRATAPGDVVHRLVVGHGGVATSGIHARTWTGPDGVAAHHLIDPGTGRPAWTGVVAATAVGADAVEAEVLAKAALLSGPRGARRWLRRHGGVVQTEDGRIEVVAPAPTVRLAA